MGKAGPLRFLLACGLVSALLHALVFAAAPAQDRPVIHVPSRHSGSLMLVAPQVADQPPRSPTTGKGEPVAVTAETESALIESVAPTPDEPRPVAIAAADAMEEGEYVPRPLLSAPPQPETPVMLTWPEFDGTKPLYQGVLALYIDDQGIVQRIRMMEGDLPPELEAQARMVFLGTRFSPGQLDGVAVRSRVQVEVVFEKPEPPVPPVRGLRH